MHTWSIEFYTYCKFLKIKFMIFKFLKFTICIKYFMHILLMVYNHGYIVYNRPYVVYKSCIHSL